MRRLPLGLVSMIVLLLPLTSSGRGTHDNGSMHDRFLGAWRLVWLEQPDADGKIHKPDCSGLLVYTRDGHMLVQVMYPDGPAGTSSAPVEYSQGGYEASFGRYQIEDERTFSFHVEGALVRALVGKDLKRRYELSGQQLIVRSADRKEHWRAAWEHY